MTTWELRDIKTWQCIYRGTRSQVVACMIGLGRYAEKKYLVLPRLGREFTFKG
jgi:hypothetical protein